MSGVSQLPSAAHPVADNNGITDRVWFNYWAAIDRFLRNKLPSGAITVADLPGASTVGAGARRFVTDATATTFLSTVAGGGANSVPVVSDGTNWLIG